MFCRGKDLTKASFDEDSRRKVRREKWLIKLKVAVS